MAGVLAAVWRDVPVDPDAEQARRWIIDELSKPEYEAAKPTWFDRLSSAFLEWLFSLDVESAEGPPGLFIVVIVAIIIGALVAAFFIFGPPALNRRSNLNGPLFGHDDERSANAMRLAAAEAAGRGEWALATEEVFRAIARGLAERTILTITPGTTAHGFASRAATAFPRHADELARSAQTFDQVRYLGQDGSREAYEQVAELESRLRAARPELLSAGTPLLSESAR